jgi:hypothetical protein
MSDQVKDSETAEKPETKNGFSRRDFLRSSAAGAGAAAAAIGVTREAFGATIPDANIPSIRIPKDLVNSLAEEAQPATFGERGISGAEVFANALQGRRIWRRCSAAPATTR